MQREEEKLRARETIHNDKLKKTKIYNIPSIKLMCLIL